MFMYLLIYTKSNLHLSIVIHTLFYKPILQLPSLPRRHIKNAQIHGRIDLKISNTVYSTGSGPHFQHLMPCIAFI